MREHSLRTGSSYQGRGEHRPYQGNAKPGRTRPRRSANLGRLRDELGFDLLGAALGLSDEALNIVIDGRGHAREEEYVAHMSHRLKEAGIPNDWLERQFAPIAPEYLRSLRQFAAESRNKAPIRRANFRRLALAFDSRTAVLADALDMVPSSISNVAEGRLEFDDGRFGHINPRLMQAGFPDGWLEQAEPELTDDMVAAVTQLATDEYERQLAEEEEARLNQGQAFVDAGSSPQAEPSVEPVAAPVDTSQETVMATANQRQAKSTKTAQPSFSGSAPQFKAAGMPGASKPMAHPSAGGGAKLSRSVLAAGRKLGGGASGKPVAPPPAAPTEAPKAATKTTAAKKAPAAPAPAPAAATTARAPRGTVSKEVSLARAEALEKLLDGTRRGVKVTLWRDILGSTLPFWGNIRRGAVLFRDELARGVEQAMGLPDNWLDHPKFPPKTMAAWVTDPTAPVPTALEAQAAANDAQDAGEPATPTAGPAAATNTAGTKPSVTKPFARQTAPQPPKVTMTKAPAAPPTLPGATMAAQAPAAPAATQARLETPAPAATAAAPAAPEAPLVSAPGVGMTPAGNASPMVSALFALIQARMSSGTFSDADAMKLIHALSASA